MSIDIQPLARTDIGAASAVLTRAFVTDELFVALFPDNVRRLRQTESYCRWTVGTHLLGGAVVETTASLQGVCIWQPPNHRFPWWLGLRAAPDALDLLRSAGGDVRRSLGWFSHEERMRQELLPRAHWFLVMLGVDPAVQRYGLGAALALHGLARADAQRVPSYVITNTEAHVRLYAKMGFRVADRTPAEEDSIGVDTWRMVRPVLGA